MRNLEVIRLSADEVEAIRLIDVEGLDQNGAAENIRVSRITIQRIYKSARRKIADAIIHARAIKIESENNIKYCRCPAGRKCFCNKNILKGGD